MIKAGREELMASNDSVYGPFTLQQKNEFLKQENTGRLQEKKFNYSSRHRFKYSNYVRLKDKEIAER